ncbi:hypothetical protein JTE90_027237 [Oedothorax gibbosus]|uniref:THAP-type domain-containing protein n=1 Tax=Oedothorax gibbosus TaxID=931172 RepID=A0AAV6U345_9ARAC|nr:hypothetical protein JTE90_027237 [Oedothorax gibbosus]
MKRDAKKNPPLSEKSCRHVCEDHFDLEKDMENYIRYKLMGGRIFLKKGVLPHRFDCQTSKKETVAASTERAAKRKPSKDPNHPDWIPSIFDFSKKNENRNKSKVARYNRVKNRNAQVYF